MNPPKKKLSGGLFPNNKRAFVDSTLAANKDLDWVKRLREKNTPSLTLPGEDRPSTHLMGDDGKGYVFPTLVRQPSEKGLTNLGDLAEDYARETGTGIQFKNKQQADWFASHKNASGGYGGYKQGTGVLPQFKNGVKKTKIPKLANGLQRIQASDASSRSLLSAGLQAGANAVLPGAGLGIQALEAGSAALKDENGLYKSRVGQALDGISPVTALKRFGNLLSGNLSDLDGQQKIKDAMAKQKLQQTQAATWAGVGADPSTVQPSYRKGARKVAQAPIEIEGDEPQFSKPVGGKRVLKSFTPGGPTHAEGGIAVLAEDGDAVVTAKGGKGREAVLAHQLGDHARVEELISQMPADKKTTKNKRAAGGLKGISFKAGTSTLDDLLGGLPGQVPLQQAAGMANMDQILATKNPVTRNYIPDNSKDTTTATAPTTPFGTAATTAAQVLPTAFNLGQGLFGQTEKTTRRTYTPRLTTYADSSNPQRQASTQAMRGQVANARNVSGGSAGNIRSNTAQAFADNAQRLVNIEDTEVGRRLQVQNANNQDLNRAQLINNQVNDQADQLDLQNAAKKSEALAKGITGISDLASNSLLMSGQQAAQAKNAGYMKDFYRNFTTDTDGKVVLRKAKKGIKKVFNKK